jgi:hypothetical protein
VERELGEMRPEIARVDVLERFAGTLMELQPARRGQLVVERVPDQRVPEPQAPGRSRNVADDPFGHRLVQGVEQLAARTAAELLEHVQLELAAQHAGGDQQGATGAGQPLHALADHGADAIRDAKVCVGL